MLVASLAGRVGFLMLPLGLIFLAGSAATAGALVAAFSVASALAPARGRIVDRRGPPALAAFALACAVATWALVLAIVAADAPSVVVVVLGGLVGLVVPPLGPFTRAALGRALRERGERLQRAYGLDTAGEESALIVAPLLIALAAGLLSPAAALTIAAAVMLAGTVAASRTALAATAEPPTADARAGPLPAPLWLLYGALAATAAALGAIEIAVPAAAREQGHVSAAGFVLAAMAAGTVAGSLLAGRRHWSVPPQWRVVALTVPMAAGVALAATASGRLELLGAALVIPGAVLGALFASRVRARRPAGAGGIGDARIRLAGDRQQRRAGPWGGRGRSAHGALRGRRRALDGCRLRARGRRARDRGGTYVRTRTQPQTDVRTSLSTLRRKRFTKRQGIATQPGGGS